MVRYMSPLQQVGWLSLSWSLKAPQEKGQKGKSCEFKLKIQDDHSQWNHKSIRSAVAAPAYFEKKRFLLWQTADVRISREEMLNSSPAIQKAFSISTHGMGIMVQNSKLKLTKDLDSPIQKSDIFLVAGHALLFIERIKCSQGLHQNQ